MSTTIPSYVLPIYFTVGNRTYRIKSALQNHTWKDDEYSIYGVILIERAAQMCANLGREEAEYILANQRDIPDILRGKLSFAFTEYRICGNMFVISFSNRWFGTLSSSSGRWYRNEVVLERIK